MRPERFQLGDSRSLHLVMPTRDQVRAVACPTCGSLDGRACRRPAGPGHHRARVDAARAAVRGSRGEV